MTISVDRLIMAELMKPSLVKPFMGGAVILVIVASSDCKSMYTLELSLTDHWPRVQQDTRPARRKGDVSSDRSIFG